MRVEEINEEIFDNFVKSHIMKNYFQTSSFAKIMDKTVFDIMYIGVFEDNFLRGVALILYKYIAPTIKYGYSPRGFVIDYYNEDLLKSATESIKEFFNKKGFAFIKINPEITYSIVDFNVEKKFINKKNKELLRFMQSLGYNKLADNLYFESLLPKFNPIINLSTYNIEDINNILNSKFNEEVLKGISVKIGEEKDLDAFYDLLNKAKILNFSKYKNYYSILKQKDMIDLFLITINYNDQLKALQREYHITNSENLKINDEFSNNSSDTELYNKKMESDKKLNNIRHEITKISNYIKNNIENEILAGALLIKFEGRISLALAGYNKNLTDKDYKFYLYYKVIDEYKKSGYKFFDLNGITGDFSIQNPYKNLNTFKLQFNPVTYEYIGELDLITNNTFYQLLLSTGMLKKEFSKEEIK